MSKLQLGFDQGSVGRTKVQKGISSPVFLYENLQAFLHESIQQTKKGNQIGFPSSIGTDENVHGTQLQLGLDCLDGFPPCYPNAFQHKHLN